MTDEVNRLPVDAAKPPQGSVSGVAPTTTPETKAMDPAVMQQFVVAEVLAKLTPDQLASALGGRCKAAVVVRLDLDGKFALQTMSSVQSA